MSTQPALSATRREDRGKGSARKLRAAGRIPAVVYGKDMDALTVSLDAREAEHLFHGISVENTILDLRIGDDGDSMQTLVREIQTHPFRPTILHVDFLRIQEGVEVEVEVPIELVGTPTGVRLNGGVLEQIVHEVEVRCIPSKIPEVFELDITPLEIGDALHVSDLTLGEGVELLIDPTQTVCLVSAPRVLEEEEAAEVEEGAEPAIVGEEKEEEDEEDRE